MRNLKDCTVHEDQRRHKRFRLQGEVFAAFVAPNKPIIVGKILDVSPRGLGIQYLATGKVLTGPTSIKIFGLNSPRMEKIESTVVYDLEIPEKSSNLAKVRRCGIKFQGQGSEVQAKLRGLSRNHARCCNPRQDFSAVSLRK